MLLNALSALSVGIWLSIILNPRLVPHEISIPCVCLGLWFCVVGTIKAFKEGK